MVVINFTEDQLDIIRAEEGLSKVLLIGPTGSGKTTVLQERYKHLVETLKVPSEKILVLLPRTAHLHHWREHVDFKSSSNLWRTTFYNFIQEEIKVYYPIISANCTEIVHKNIKPVFLDFDTSRFLISRVVQWQRENKNAFTGIAAETSKIASDISANLLRASLSCIQVGEISERLCESLELKDEQRQQAFIEAGDIQKAYRKKCMELGMLDYGMAVELFSECLMKDAAYKQQLMNRIQHLLIDNIEECTPVEVDFLEALLPGVKTGLLAYNSTGGYGALDGGNYRYVLDRLLNNSWIAQRMVAEQPKSYCCSDFMNEFSEMLFDNIENFQKHRVNPSAFIERMPAVELRSEMLEQMGKRVCDLVLVEGYRPSDITILSTYADPVTEYVLSHSLGNKGIVLNNIARKDKFMDNETCQALITLAQVCYPSCGIYPNKDHLKVMFKVLTGMDAIKCSVLAAETSKGRPWAFLPDLEESALVKRFDESARQQYEYLRSWIMYMVSQNSDLPLYEFIARAFLELVISEHTGQQEIAAVGSLMHAAQRFCGIVSRFNNINATRGFIETVLAGMSSGEGFYLEENSNMDTVLFATPQAYLSRPLSSKVIILTSLSSKNWAPRNAKELGNAYVLSRGWERGACYTGELEEKNQKSYIAALMRNILKRCREKIITFESNLSAGGYENDGPLAEYFEEILN